MRQMVSGTVLADLRRRAGRTDVIASRVLRTWGESESGLAERLGGRIAALDESGNPTLAFLAAGIEGIKVRITVKAAGAAEAAALLDAESDVLTELLGELVFSADDESMEEVVVRLLGESGETVSIAETFTGGLMASRL
ncbi:MAG TPA: damage-inducible protein CinA, partial [Acidimicrobiaceae bacterium]|nr:damage-inducible protein CinA [Acidimicrobiaceae bacterium]